MKLEFSLSSLLLLALAAGCLVHGDVINEKLADHMADHSVDEKVVQQSKNNKKLEEINLKLSSPWKPYTGLKRDSVFFEQFESSSISESKWVVSNGKKNDDFNYDGKWAFEKAAAGSYEGDFGLVMKDKSHHHAISRPLDSPITFEGKDIFVLQYEVKFQESLECGGAYVKLISAPSSDEKDAFHPTTFSDQHGYTIMFGPDKCGSENKLHFIFRHKNKKTGKIVEHHNKKAPRPPTWDTKLTHLYTLIIFPKENRYELSIDNKERVSGSLLENDFEPPVVPPAEIPDPNDVKPSDWDDRQNIPDPDPENYNESVPREIVDSDDKMPDDWYPDEPLEIDEVSAVQPPEWDTEIEGEWVAPKVPNPKCVDNKCGEWRPRMIKNPAFKERKNVPNPKYSGVWKPRMIPNPDHHVDNTVGNMTPITAIGFELWTLQSQILFDNVLVSNSISLDELAKLTTDTWGVKNAIEKEINELSETDADAESTKSSPFSWREQLSVASIVSFFNLLITSPRQTWDLYPALLGITLAITTLIFVFLFSSVFSSKKTSARVPSDRKKNDDEDESEGADSATDERDSSKKANDQSDASAKVIRRNTKGKNFDEASNPLLAQHQSGNESAE